MQDKKQNLNLNQMLRQLGLDKIYGQYVVQGNPEKLFPLWAFLDPRLVATSLIFFFIYLSYSGSDCSIIPTCHNVSDCSSNGLCVDYDVCKCDKGWTGDNCTQFSCEHLDYCSGNAFASLHYE